MWLFSRRKRPKEEPLEGPVLVRRTEIIIEREWTSTTLRKHGVAGETRKPPGTDDPSDGDKGLEGAK